VTEYVGRAAFLDQVQVGQRIKLTSSRGSLERSADLHEPWTVTGKRLDTYEKSDGRHDILVCLVGMKDDGSPVYQTGASWLGVIIYEPLPDEEPAP
jgi:hypothetical protein